MWWHVGSRALNDCRSFQRPSAMPRRRTRLSAVATCSQVTIWEAPPAVLFGANTSFGGSGGGVPTGTAVGQNSAIPEMMVDESGSIRLPFVGAVRAAGLTPPQVEREIAVRLRGMAHDPQVSVRISQNASSTVAVVGDVTTSGRIPITPRGERLLDAIAAAGGTTEPVGKVSVQVTRGGREALVPLEAVIRDPAQNIRLGPERRCHRPFPAIQVHRARCDQHECGDTVREHRDHTRGGLGSRRRAGERARQCPRRLRLPL